MLTPPLNLVEVRGPSEVEGMPYLKAIEPGALTTILGQLLAQLYSAEGKTEVD